MSKTRAQQVAEEIVGTDRPGLSIDPWGIAEEGYRRGLEAAAKVVADTSSGVTLRTGEVLADVVRRLTAFADEPITSNPIESPNVEAEYDDFMKYTNSLIE